MEKIVIEIDSDNPREVSALLAAITAMMQAIPVPTKVYWEMSK